MTKHRALIPFILLLFLIPSAAETVGGGEASLSNLQIFLGYNGEAFLSAREAYDPKLQGQNRFSAGLRWSFKSPDDGWVPVLMLRTDLILRGTSNLTGGYLYNGLDGGALSFGGGVLFPRADWSPGTQGLFSLLHRGRFGLAGGFTGGLFEYTTGLNYFYFPAIFLEPSWELPALLVRSWGALGLRISLPLTWELRKDLDVSMGAGFSLQGVYTFPGRLKND